MTVAFLISDVDQERSKRRSWYQSPLLGHQRRVSLYRQHPACQRPPRPWRDDHSVRSQTRSRVETARPPAGPLAPTADPDSFRDTPAFTGAVRQLPVGLTLPPCVLLRCALPPSEAASDLETCKCLECWTVPEDGAPHTVPPMRENFAHTMWLDIARELRSPWLPLCTRTPKGFSDRMWMSNKPRARSRATWAGWVGPPPSIAFLTHNFVPKSIQLGLA